MSKIANDNPINITNNPSIFSKEYHNYLLNYIKEFPSLTAHLTLLNLEQHQDKIYEAFRKAAKEDKIFNFITIMNNFKLNSDLHFNDDNLTILDYVLASGSHRILAYLLHEKGVGIFNPKSIINKDKQPKNKDDKKENHDTQVEENRLREIIINNIKPVLCLLSQEKDNRAVTFFKAIVEYLGITQLFEEDEYNLLHIAIQNNNVELVQYLVTFAVKNYRLDYLLLGSNCEDNKGKTAYDLATNPQIKKILEDALLSFEHFGRPGKVLSKELTKMVNGKKVLYNLERKENEESLLVFAKKGEINAVKALLLLGIPITSTYSGKQAIHHAVENNQNDMLKFLLNYAEENRLLDKVILARIDANKIETSPYYIFKEGHAKLSSTTQSFKEAYDKLLIQRKEQIAKQVRQSFMGEISFYDIELPLTLSPVNSETSIQNTNNEILKREKAEEVFKAETKNLKLKADTSKEAILCHFAKTNRLKGFEALVNLGTNPSVQYKGKLPIHWAIETKNFDIVQFIVDWSLKNNSLEALGCWDGNETSTNSLEILNQLHIESEQILNELETYRLMARKLLLEKSNKVSNKYSNTKLQAEVRERYLILEKSMKEHFALTQDPKLARQFNLVPLKYVGSTSQLTQAEIACEYAAKDDLAGFLSYLKSCGLNASATLKTDQGIQPIHMAAKAGAFNIIKFLIGLSHKPGCERTDLLLATTHSNKSVLDFAQGAIKDLLLPEVEWAIHLRKERDKDNNKEKQFLSARLNALQSGKDIRPVNMIPVMRDATSEEMNISEIERAQMKMEVTSSIVQDEHSVPGTSFKL